jgi:hypothetical protein
MLSRRFTAAVNNKTYLGLHVECPIFLSDFKQIWVLPTCFRKSSKYQISLKCVQWDPRWHMQTDRHGEPKRRFCRDYTNAPAHHVSVLPVLHSTEGVEGSSEDKSWTACCSYIVMQVMVLQGTRARPLDSRMSAGSPEEMSGFLEVKVPARVRRRRGLAPWKVCNTSHIT